MTLLAVDIEDFLDRFAPYVGAEEEAPLALGAADDLEYVIENTGTTMDGNDCEADVENAEEEVQPDIEDEATTEVPDVEEIVHQTEDIAPDVEEIVPQTGTTTALDEDVPVTPARRHLRALLRQQA